MLTFTVRIGKQVRRMSEPESDEKDIDWHVGEAPPQEGFEEADLQVLSVYADGHELEYISHYFANVPCVRDKYSTLWRGEWARFIWDNLDKRMPPSLQ
jgi:hypothetical protein